MSGEQPRKKKSKGREVPLGDRVINAVTAAIIVLDRVLTVGMHLKAAGSVFRILNDNKRFKLARGIGEAVKWKAIFWAMPKISDWIASSLDPVPTPIDPGAQSIHKMNRDLRVTREIADSVRDVRSVFSKGDPALVADLFSPSNFDPDVADWLRCAAVGDAALATDEAGDLTEERMLAEVKFLDDKAALLDRLYHHDDDPLVHGVLQRFPEDVKRHLDEIVMRTSDLIFSFIIRMRKGYRSSCEVSADVAVTADALALLHAAATTSVHQTLTIIGSLDYESDANLMLNYLPIMDRLQAIAVLSHLAESYPRTPVRIRPGLASMLDTLGFTSYSQLERIAAPDSIPKAFSVIAEKKRDITAFLRDISDPTNVIVAWITARRRLAEVVYPKYDDKNNSVQEPNASDAKEFLSGHGRKPGKPYERTRS